MRYIRILRGLQFLGIFLLLLNAKVGYAQNVRMDSLKNLLAQTEDINEKIDLLNSISSISLHSNVGNANEYIDEALKLAKSINFFEAEVLAYLNKGWYQYYQSDYDSSLHYLQQSIDLHEAKNELTLIKASTFQLIAAINRRKGFYTLALENLHDALNILDELEGLKNKGSDFKADKAINVRSIIYNSLGILYGKINENEKVEEYFFKFLSVQKQVGDEIGISNGLNNLGYHYKLQKQYEKAIPYLYESVNVLSESDSCDWVYAYFNLGDIFEITERDSAEYYLNAGLQQSRNCHNSYIAVLSLVSYARLNIRKQKYKLAEAQLLEAYELSSRDQLRGERVEVLKVLVDYYKLRGKTASALQFMEEYYVSKDSIFNEENTKELARKEAEFEWKRQKEKLKSEQEEENQIYQDKLSRQRSILGVLLLGLIIAGVLIFFLNKYNRLKQKLVLELEEKNKQILNTQKQLVKQEKLASLGQLTAGLAHEIKNPLNFINNFSEGAVELLEELKIITDKNKEQITSDQWSELKETLEDIYINNLDVKKNGNRLDRIVQNMMDHAQKPKYNQEEVNLNELIDDHLKLAKYSYRLIEPDFDVHIQKNYSKEIPPIKVYPQELGKVIINLLKNAFYAVSEKNRITETAFRPIVSVNTSLQEADQYGQETQVIISIRDNGTGISVDIIENIFEPFFTTKPAGQGNSGLGLSIAYDIVVKRHQGQLFFDSQEDQFAEVIIKLPVSNP